MLRKRWVSLNTAVAVAAVLAVPGSPATALTPGAVPPGKISWRPCPAKDPVEGTKLKGLECGTLAVPLDHARPGGEKITLALTRARHTAPAARYQGPLLLNRGGPGAHGRDMPAAFVKKMPKNVVAAYDWIGVDPRGVGASRPAMVCDKTYQAPGRARPDTVPRTPALEAGWRARARAFSDDCARRYRKLLPHMGSYDWVRDLDAVRAALGQPKINYLGYSYGTYLGALYATVYPARVRRMVLDSVVRPSGVWYDSNLDQNVAFEKRIRAFFGWVARHRGAYRLRGGAKGVERAYYKVRAELTRRPLDRRIGPAELDDTFLDAGYADDAWPQRARALSDYAVRRDPRALRKLWEPLTWLDQNNYTVYNAVQCRDAPWPRSWNRWRRDNWRLYNAGYRFETWGNAWYNAPCATWAAAGGPRPRVLGRPGLPGILLIQSSQDAATPYAGAIETHRRFPGSRLVVQTGGGDHGLTLSGDKCVQGRVDGYLARGSLPGDRPGPDATCAAGPPPAPGRAAKGSKAAKAHHRHLGSLPAE